MQTVTLISPVGNAFLRIQMKYPKAFESCSPYEPQDSDAWKDAKSGCDSRGPYLDPMPVRIVRILLVRDIPGIPKGSVHQ